jgi:hypothetical protein
LSPYELCTIIADVVTPMETENGRQERRPPATSVRHGYPIRVPRE